jgi:hypothetical protein
MALQHTVPPDIGRRVTEPTTFVTLDTNPSPFAVPWRLMARETGSVVQPAAKRKATGILTPAFTNLASEEQQDALALYQLHCREQQTSLDILKHFRLKCTTTQVLTTLHGRID